jgi:hypothetical protein
MLALLPVDQFRATTGALAPKIQAEETFPRREAGGEHYLQQAN